MTVIIDTNGITAPTANITNTITANTMVDATGNTVTIATVVKGAAKAWGSYAYVGIASTPTLRGAFNISSITRNSTGNFTLAFTTAMPNVNYSFSGSATFTTGNEPSFCNAITKTTANVTMVNGYIGSNSLWAVYDYGLDFVIFN